MPAEKPGQLTEAEQLVEGEVAPVETAPVVEQVEDVEQQIETEGEAMLERVDTAIAAAEASAGLPPETSAEIFEKGGFKERIVGLKERIKGIKDVYYEELLDIITNPRAKGVSVEMLRFLATRASGRIAEEVAKKLARARYESSDNTVLKDRVLLRHLTGEDLAGVSYHEPYDYGNNPKISKQIKRETAGIAKNLRKTGHAEEIPHITPGVEMKKGDVSEDRLYELITSGDYTTSGKGREIIESLPDKSLSAELANRLMDANKYYFILNNLDKFANLDKEEFLIKALSAENNRFIVEKIIKSLDKFPGISLEVVGMLLKSAPDELLGSLGKIDKSYHKEIIVKTLNDHDIYPRSNFFNHLEQMTGVDLREIVVEVVRAGITSEVSKNKEKLVALGVVFDGESLDIKSPTEAKFIKARLSLDWHYTGSAEERRKIIDSLGGLEVLSAEWDSLDITDHEGLILEQWIQLRLEGWDLQRLKSLFAELGEHKVTNEYFEQLGSLDLKLPERVLTHVKEKIAKEERILAMTYVRKALIANSSIEQIQREEQQKIEEVVSNSDYFKAIPSDILEDILIEKRFKTQFEVHASGGSLDPSRRSLIESQVFGYEDDQLKNKRVRPNYGYMSDDTNGHVGSAEYSNIRHYGNVSIKFKKEVVGKKTTMTLNDSLSGLWLAVPSLKPHFAIVSQQRAGVIKSSSHPEDWASLYTEVQYHGPLRTQVIDSVHISEKGGTTKEEIDRVVGLIDQHNQKNPDNIIKVVVY